MTISKQIIDAMRKANAKEKRMIRRDRVHGDCFGYTDGVTELQLKNITHSNPTADAVEHLTAGEEIRRAISHLSPTHQRRIYAFFWDGLTYAEIAT
ncbi:sigma-70 region 4 domain-containing protein, partial [Ruminococcaceae bacterium OttesenSCG-928-A16]|nr:sigma-70 region 4 domain-containing protein [Ruminococcaceae bacterium OttesenSCG-928-A16]